MKRSIFLLFFFLSTSLLYSQQKMKAKLADSYFEKYDYTEAVTIYEKLAQANPLNVHYVSRTAQCYRFIGDTQKAEEWYAKLAAMGNGDPMYIYYYAEMLDANKKYAQARTYYEKYREKKPSDSRAGHKLNTVQQLPSFYKDSSFYRINNLSINSEYSDFGLFPYGGERFLFASNREDDAYSKSTYNWNRQPYFHLYRVTRNTDGTFNPIKPIWDINSAYNEGPVSFDPSKNIFYITRNNTSSKNKHGVNHLKLSMARFDESSITGIIDFNLNHPEHSVGHATVSKDGERLYFASDMPGSIGGTDIYVSFKEGGTWGSPRNLGKKINTEGNEMFPFISEDNKLYFSSNGLSGLGGLDVYSAEMENEEFKTPKNVGYPVNSSKDDFSFYISPDNKTGFFSSNRPGGKGDDDMYAFELVKPLKAELRGIVRNDENETPIADAKVVLQGFDGKSVETVTDADGKFHYEANWNMDYSLTVSKEKFTTTRKQFTTSGSEVPFQIEVRIKYSEYNLEAMVINKEDKNPISSAIITVTGANKQKQTTVSDNSGVFAVSLERGTIYEVKIEKPKYMTSVFVVSTLDVGPGIIRKTFSLDQLKETKKF